MGKLIRSTLGLLVLVNMGYAAGGCVTEPVDVAKCVMENPDCPTDLPVCKPSEEDPAVGRCEPCEPGDCGGSTLCDESSGRCVQCLGPEDCPLEEPICRTSGDPEDNRCVQCITSEDCPTAQRPHCDPARDICVECLDDEQCVSAEEPSCDLERNECVECVDDAQCEGNADTPVCDSASGQCVACTADSQCDSPSEAQCDPTTGSCVPCTMDIHCASQGARSACFQGLCVECHAAKACETDPSRPACGKDGLCVECTPSDESACQGTVCDPMTETCTNIAQGSKRVCESCIADSECGDDAKNPSEIHRCIALSFSGAPQGGRCLEQRASNQPECTRPFLPRIFRQSLSGEAEIAYCGINEARTTCEAVLAGRSGTACPNGDQVRECAPQGALCESMSGLKTCTYPCDNFSECPQGLACESGRCRL